MGLFQKKPSQANGDSSSGEEKEYKTAEYVEDVEHSPAGHEEVDPALARRVVRKFDRCGSTAILCA